jgi:hypothetical protein
MFSRGTKQPVVLFAAGAIAFSNIRPRRRLFRHIEGLCRIGTRQVHLEHFFVHDLASLPLRPVDTSNDGGRSANEAGPTIVGIRALVVATKTGEQKTPARLPGRGFGKNPAITYSRAIRTTIGPGCLTAVFGMGTGVSSQVWSPERRFVRNSAFRRTA